MKKRVFSLILVLALLSCLGLSAHADDDPPIRVGQGWSVVFDTSNKLVNNPANMDLSSALSGLQPGDTMVLTIPIQNLNPKTVDWYMWNFVRKTLEQVDRGVTAAQGGYSYTLTYTGDGSRVYDDAGNELRTVTLYDSEKVGGDSQASDRQGLREASSNLEDYFFLATLAQGQGGQIDLTVHLDGESQDNNYQDTLARLQFRFAVELNSPDSPGGPGRPDIVRTGDQYNLNPFYIAMLISGLIFLYLALDSITDRIYGVKRKRG